MADTTGEAQRLSASGRHFRTLTLHYLRTHLSQARAGELAPQWRDDLAPRNSGTTAATRFTDAETLAIAELHETPFAPWEPHQAHDWKQALDSWYITSRAALNEERRIAETHWHEDALLLDSSLAYEADERTDELTYRILNADNVDRHLDLRRTAAHSLYVTTRDTLGASYRAGLAAGGLATPGRWVDWYRARIACWPDHAAAAAAAANLDNHTTREKMQDLPAYWCPRT